MTIVVTYDGVASTIIPDLVIEHVDRELFGSVRDVYQEVAGRESAWLFAEEPGDKTLEMPCWLVSNDAATRRATIRQIALWLAKSERKQLIISDEPDRFWEAKLIKAPKVQEMKVMGRFNLEWRTGPYAYETTLSTETLSNASNTSFYETTFEILDELPAYPVVRITAVTGGIAGFQFTLNGDTLLYSGSMAIGDQVNFSSISKTATWGSDYDVNLTGAFDISANMLSLVTGTFGYLVPGINSFSLSSFHSGGQEFSIDIVWRRRFL